uniref:Uncharacterized protein n=1 Tax=Pundamilia nyererei TaxID=303518 RepID=A0A3B4G2U0_9CICH
MSSWVKSPAGGRRPSGNPNGRKECSNIFAAFRVSFNVTVLKLPAKPEGGTPADRRKTLYQKFYRQVQEERKPADCVCFSSSQRDYPKSLSQCLQERGLSVEMLYLQAESGLTRALQDVRAEGSPLCILVEQTNVALSSCTVIIFSESLKIHRNMPKDQAMDFVLAEYNRGLAKERPPRDPADIAAEASQLLDDFLDREKIARHTVPSETRQLLVLLGEGVHLYPEELETISEYVRSRQDHVQGETITQQYLQKRCFSFDFLYQLCFVLRSYISVSPALICFFLFLVAHPKTKPPPLLSLHRLPGPSLGGPIVRGPLSSHIPYGGPGVPRGPLLHPPPVFHPGPRGPTRGAPPTLKSARPPLLSSPGWSLVSFGGFFLSFLKLLS